jgi:plastocyanin
MRRRAVLCLLAVAAAGCATGTSGSGPGGETRTVLVDYSHDEFASAYMDYFPQKVTLHAGDTVTFRQTWTGEPHSVTMGTLVDALMEKVKPFIVQMEAGKAIPEGPPADIEELEKPLPPMVGDEGKASQNGAQPCFLDSGQPPADPATPCTDEQQKQPPFNGRQSFYSSGFIPYQGSRGNTYSVTLARDIKPGIYNYYCNYHYEFMSGEIEVAPKSAGIPSQAEVNRAARKEIDSKIRVAVANYRKAVAKKLEPPPDAKDVLLKPGERYFSGNWAGVPAFEGEDFRAMINEFVPKTIRAKLGEKVTWALVGGHTISFDVPKYFPIIEVRKDETVVRNPKLDAPAGGSPPLPEAPDDHEGPAPPLDIDGGAWDGSGFFSSGLIFGEPGKYSLTFSKPGSYRFACLVHPPMVGTVVVRA